MAGMSGVELLEHLKAVDAGIEVIMLTAYETVDTLRLALRLGACDYLNKPFEIPIMPQGRRQRDGAAFPRRRNHATTPCNSRNYQRNFTTPAYERGNHPHPRGDLRQHHPRYQRPVDGHLRLHPAPETSASAPVPAWRARTWIFQGPAQDHHPPGDQLHRNLRAATWGFSGRARARTPPSWASTKSSRKSRNCFASIRA